MKKRFFAVLLAATMVMGMSMTALADGEQGDGTTVTVASDVQAATVKISVPTDAKFVMNPFELPVGEGDDAVTDQIISDNIEVKNLGDTAVSMTVSATVALADKAGKTILITDATKINDADAKTGLVAKNAVVKVGLKQAAYDSETEKYSPSDTFFQNGTDDVQVVMAKFGTAQSLAAIKLTVPDEEKAASDDGDVNSRAFVDITGVLASKASTAWLATDNLQVTLKFNLVPTVID